MKQLINKNTTLKILLISAICVLAFKFINRQQQDEIIRIELIKQFSKKLIEKEIKTRKMIYTIEQRIETVVNKDKATQKRIESSDNNYKNIIRNLKIIDNEKIKTDLEIINASDSSDWIWFSGRFPKSKNNNRLSVETDTTVREPSKNRQDKGNRIKQSR